MSDARSPLDHALDLFVYAPLGVALQVQQEFPELVARGRQAVTTQGAMYRAVGEFAASQVRQKAEQHAGGIYDLLSSVGLLERRDSDAAANPAQQSDEGASDASAEPRGEGAAAEPDSSDGGDRAPAGPSEGLAIADYDALPAAQILPLLGELTPEERAEVARHEAAGRGRRTILGRIERLAAQDEQ